MTEDNDGLSLCTYLLAFQLCGSDSIATMSKRAELLSQEMTQEEIKKKLKEMLPKEIAHHYFGIHRIKPQKEHF